MNSHRVYGFLNIPAKKFCRDHNHRYRDVEAVCRAKCAGWNSAIIAISKQVKELENVASR